MPRIPPSPPARRDVTPVVPAGLRACLKGLEQASRGREPALRNAALRALEGIRGAYR